MRVVLPATGENCDPTYGKVDEVLELITKSKSLHVLMVLDRARRPLRFTDIKARVDASSTTISRRLKELEDAGLVVRSLNPASPQSNLYTLSDVGRGLSPVMQSLFEWAKDW
ncbi:MAG TPA: transcriptional regulator [Candidatus Poseidoniales archaeon]|nr:MAG TPA: transcriptional regulator [Candidatus Poseidoniales archaeon]